jgi:hypothetical protein
MDMDESLIEKSGRSATSQIWPGRYNVKAQVNYRNRRGKLGVMQVITFQPEMPEDEYAVILEEAGIDPGTQAWTRFISQAKDTFSHEQAAALVAYLNTRQGTSAYLREAKFPAPDTIGASAIPTLPSFRDGQVYRLFTEHGYSLPFKVEAINMKTYLYMARLFDEMKSTLDHD